MEIKNIKNIKNITKIVAVCATGVLLGASLGMNALQHNAIDSQSSLIKEKVEMIEGLNTALELKPMVEYKDVIVNKEVIVNIENTDSYDALVLTLEDRAIIEDIEDFAEEVNMEDALILKAIELINSEDFKDLVEDEDLVDDEDDVNVIKVYSDFDKIEDISVNVDDEEGEVTLKVKIEDTEEETKMYLDVTVTLEDDSYEITNIVEHV